MRAREVHGGAPAKARAEPTIRHRGTGGAAARTIDCACRFHGRTFAKGASQISPDGPRTDASDPAPAAPACQSAAELELGRRLRQQEIVADYALMALRAQEPDILFDAACRLAAQGLDAQYAKILQYQPASQDFRVRSAFGWDPAITRDARLGGGARSPAGHAFRTGKPVVCGDNNETGNETGPADEPFRLPRWLREHGMLSAILAPIREAGQGEAYGVLEVDSAKADAFGQHDAAFLRALANILAAALETLRSTEALRRSEAFAAAVLDACPDCVEVLNDSGIVTRINRNGLQLLHLDLPASRLGLNWVVQWPAESRAQAEQALDLARAGGIGRFEAYRANLGGAPIWWDVLIAPIPTGDYVAVSRDATAQILATTAKDRALHDKDLMMLEVHHRVKNSLQLVQNLLSLQARAAGDDETATRLGESAARVRTIAAVHDRLYRTGATLDVEVGPYLEGLIEDLQAALVEAGSARHIVLHSDAAVWRAADVPTLGLVLTELVTNSVKYGTGTIGVTFRQQPEAQPVLIVEDEGTGPDPDFDPSRSRGLGMRLLTGLLRGEHAGIEIDRGAGHARFIARLPYAARPKAQVSGAEG